MEKPILMPPHSPPANKWIEQTLMKEFCGKLAGTSSEKKATYSVRYENLLRRTRKLPRNWRKEQQGTSMLKR